MSPCTESPPSYPLQSLLPALEVEMIGVTSEGIPNYMFETYLTFELCLHEIQTYEVFLSM